MARTKKNVLEYRIYDLPAERSFICLHDESWRISDVLSNRLHFHNCLEMGFCFSDSGFLGFEEESVPFEAGDIFLIPRYIPHTTCSSKGCRSYWNYLFLDLAAILQDHMPHPSGHALSTNHLLPNRLKITAKSHPRLHFLCTCILEEAKHFSDDDRDLFHSYCLALVGELKRLRFGDSNEVAVSSRAFVLRPVLEYLNEHYMEPCNIQLLSDICHLSQTHFRRIFLSCMGTSPLRYIIELRIQQACILLNTTNEPITSIAQAVGITSISSFNRNFQQIVGQSPNQYRNSSVKPAVRQKNFILPYKGWLVPED